MYRAQKQKYFFELIASPVGLCGLVWACVGWFQRVWQPEEQKKFSQPFRASKKIPTWTGKWYRYVGLTVLRVGPVLHPTP